MEHFISRRDIIKSMGVSGCAMLLNPLLSHAKTNQKMMLQRAIPASGEKIPVIGLGSWQQFDVGQTAAERTPLKEVLKKMEELGGKLIDASPMYGRSEEVIGELTTELKNNDRFFFATKVWTTGKQEGIDQMNDSFKKMGRKKMDLMQVHNLQDWQTHLKTLKDWKAQGKVKYIGVTHYTDSAHSRLEQIVKSKEIDFVQFNYSIRSRNADKSLLNAAKDSGVAVIINEPFEQGALFRAVKGKELPAFAADYGISSWAQYFLKYIISHEAVTCAIPGTSDVKHLVDNLGAGLGKLPDAAGRKKMVEWIDKI
ncbi:aldo/keto reductase [Dyadobacter fanqingshengii]|uniref:Aldo/keto reductase n=1 Tax=Dyadobacter fanqingshengii TaxID=2906443 RepID=A0A9X1PBY6_9BACT|nr:aldo/keto reductase [Dyadobacter fanqingshengii]MCF0041732.1 aldo/keto reductase [Dyadobacter fanqingshengii]USJ36554.1 aldo/keto reductase [Dyadobacter fanqingshengii]